MSRIKIQTNIVFLWLLPLANAAW